MMKIYYLLAGFSIPVFLGLRSMGVANDEPGFTLLVLELLLFGKYYLEEGEK